MKKTKIKTRELSSSFCEKNNKSFIIKGSLLIILIGIFLLPKITLASEISSEKLIELTNNERAKYNLEPLIASQLLTKAAYKKGRDIFQNQMFAHSFQGKKFSDWIRDVGYNYSFAGENLAINFLSSEGVIKAWMDSYSHRDNLLERRFKQIGIAVINGKFESEETTLVVQIFGTPLNNASANSQIPKIFSENYYLNTAPLFDQNRSPEMLLTNSILNKNPYQNTPLKKFYLNPDHHAAVHGKNYFAILKISSRNNILKQLNNFFEHYNFNLKSEYLINIFSVLILIIIIWNYFYCFSKILKAV